MHTEASISILPSSSLWRQWIQEKRSSLHSIGKLLVRPNASLSIHQGPTHGSMRSRTTSLAKHRSNNERQSKHHHHHHQQRQQQRCEMQKLKQEQFPNPNPASIPCHVLSSWLPQTSLSSTPTSSSPAPSSRSSSVRHSTRFSALSPILLCETLTNTSFPSKIASHSLANGLL